MSSLRNSRVSVIVIPMEVAEFIPLFDEYLKKRGLDFEAVVIGGAALALIGVVSRPTRDCDILDPLNPKEILEAASEFAISVRKSGNHLQDDWFNHMPSSLSTLLPKDWPQHPQVAFKGDSLTLYTLGREDLLRTKLFALCDRGTDLSDCLALKPTLADLGGRLGYGV